MNLKVQPPTAAFIGRTPLLAPGNLPVPRYAIHYTPAHDAPITRLAASWFGRDLYTHAPCERAERPGLRSMDLNRLTAASGSDAFRFCLTDSFELAGHATEASLIDAARRFAAGRSVFSVALELATSIVCWRLA